MRGLQPEFGQQPTSKDATIGAPGLDATGSHTTPGQADKEQFQNVFKAK